MNIVLDYEDFKCLVRGGILKVGEVNIALQDIGFDKMDEAITLADKGVKSPVTKRGQGPLPFVLYIHARAQRQQPL